MISSSNNFHRPALPCLPCCLFHQMPPQSVLLIITQGSSWKIVLPMYMYMCTATAVLVFLILVFPCFHSFSTTGSKPSLLQGYAIFRDRLLVKEFCRVLGISIIEFSHFYQITHRCYILSSSDLPDSVNTGRSLKDPVSPPRAYSLKNVLFLSTVLENYKKGNNPPRADYSIWK